MMNSLIRTNMGYMDEETSSMLSIAFERENEQTKTKEILVPADSILVLQSPKRTEDPIEHPTINEALGFLYALSRGQRILTPPHQNNFIDRNTKTFFSDNYNLSFSPDVRAMFNIVSLMNYVQYNYWNEKIGIVEHLLREYRHIVANIAHQTHHALENDVLGDPLSQELKIPLMDLNPRMITSVRETLSDYQDLVDFVEGISFVAFYRDHTATNKDMKMTRIRRWLDHSKIELEALNADPEKLFNKRHIKTVIGLGRRRNKLWMIESGSNTIVDILNDKEAAKRAEDREYGRE